MQPLRVAGLRVGGVIFGVVEGEGRHEMILCRPVLLVIPTEQRSCDEEFLLLSSLSN
jgi:hypothetical protein